MPLPNATNPILPSSTSELLKDAYLLDGHFRLDPPTPEQARDAWQLVQGWYIKRVASNEYVLLQRGWEYVERNRLVDAAALEETRKIWRGSLDLRSHPQDEMEWRRELVAAGVDNMRINKIQNTLLLAGMI